MSSKPKLHIDWCSHEAAKFSVEKWHYSGSLPTPPLVKIGAWEGGKFIGCVLFSRGATDNLGTPYGLKNTEVCELTRVALRNHETPVSKILGRSLKMIKGLADGLRLVVSFADTNEGHHGGIYQATNWIYSGLTQPAPKFKDRSGRVWHSRQVSRSGVSRQYGQLRAVPTIDECTRIEQQPKHRYLYPLDDDMRRQIAPLAKPYPKRKPAPEASSDAPAYQAGEGGAAPTPALNDNA